jgi:YVTN family beta-propeller protein
VRRLFAVIAVLIGAAVAAAQTTLPVLLVLNKQENTLSIVDPATKKVVGRVTTGEGPHEVTASADGKLAFVANYGEDEPGRTISVIDIIARKELRRVNLGPLRRPHGIAFAGGKVYFTAERNKVVARYDPSSDQVDWLLGTGQNLTHMLVVNRELSKIFTANISSDSVSAIELAPGGRDWNETIIPVGKEPEGLDLSPDGREVWTAHSRDGGISIIDVTSKKVIQVLDIHTRRSNRLKFTPDGKLVLVSDVEDGELVVLSAAARREIKRIKLGRQPEGILVAPDGRRAYVAVAGENNVTIIDLETLQVTERISTGLSPDGMAWAGR